MRRKILILIILILAIAGWIYYDQPNETRVTVPKSGQIVICLGQDLTATQKSEMLNLLGSKNDTASHVFMERI